jgi:hypothetical protein
MELRIVVITHNLVTLTAGILIRGHCVPRTCLASPTYLSSGATWGKSQDGILL